jgi:Fe-S cluster assembly iron-binding protein IscA
MLSLTANARHAVQDIAERAGLPKEGGLRIVESGEHEGSFELSLVSAPVEGDEVIDLERARVYVEPATSEVLTDQTLDAASSPEGTGFLLAPQE